MDAFNNYILPYKLLTKNIMIKAFQYACTTCFILLFAFNGMSQTEKGSKLLGGSASIQFNDPFSISLNPSAGIFVLNKLAVGSSLSLSFSSSTNSRYSSAGIGPFARYYFGKSKVQYFILADVGIFRNWYNFEYPGFEDKRTTTYWNPRVGVGAVYFITPQIGLESTLNYQIYRNSDRFNNNILSLNFGFQIYLPSGKE
jgi:hypothetical protein